MLLSFRWDSRGVWCVVVVRRRRSTRREENPLTYATHILILELAPYHTPYNILIYYLHLQSAAYTTDRSRTSCNRRFATADLQPPICNLGQLATSDNLQRLIFFKQLINFKKNYKLSRYSTYRDFCYESILYIRIQHIVFYIFVYGILYIIRIQYIIYSYTVYAYTVYYILFVYGILYIRIRYIIYSYTVYYIFVYGILYIV